MVVTLIMADDVATQISQKDARLLQQSDGAPRFGKHGLQLCLVQGVSESRQRARQRVFPHCAASFFLEIRKYSCGKMSCPARKSLAAGHAVGFQMHPDREASETQVFSLKFLKSDGGKKDFEHIKYQKF